MTRLARWLVLAQLALIGGAGSPAIASESVDVPVRGQTISVTIYRPASREVKGTIVMGSGDAGWVGLAVSMSEFLSAQGYIVAGVNVRQYLSAFTKGKAHLATNEEPGDYAVIAAYLRTHGLLTPPVIVSGVSEGAALAVLAASAESNHSWIAGVITMGLPASAELAWRWKDFVTFVTKADANEPSFAPKDFIASIAPLPLVMIQSTKDEYVPEAVYREHDTTARMPKKLVLIKAANHRFTDRLPELHREFLSALAWIEQSR